MSHSSHSHHPSHRGTPSRSRRRQAPHNIVRATEAKAAASARPRLRLPDLSLGPAALSVLLHVVVLSSVAGVVLIRPAPPRAIFDAAPQMDLPMVIETPQAPEEAEPQPDPGSDEGAPTTAMGDLDQPVIDPALAILSSPSTANVFLVPSSVGVKTGTAMVGLGNNGFGTGKGSGRGKGGPGITVREIFGMSVQADRIAVVLDCSGSMLGVLEPVIKEILSAFPNAIIIGAQGCPIFPMSRYPIDTRLDSIDSTQDSGAKFLRNSLSYKQQKTVLWAPRGPGGALVEQAKEGSVQAIYWFADFQDSVDPKGMDEITEALVRAGVRLYIHSVEKEPAPSIERAVERTGGEINIKKIK